MRFRLLSVLLLIGLGFSSCDHQRVFEDHVTLENDEWHINNKPSFFVDITDTTSTYNVYFNVRHTGLYKYSNLFILFTLQGPKSEAETQRFEFKLAETDGKWLGSGLGDIYANKILLFEKVKFSKAGVYSFGIEQNMRDNPLGGIEDLGIRIEKSN